MIGFVGGDVVTSHHHHDDDSHGVWWRLLKERRLVVTLTDVFGILLPYTRCSRCKIPTKKLF